MYSVGNQIGVGKEAGKHSTPTVLVPSMAQLIRHSTDVYVVADGESNEMVLKLHR